MTALPARRLAWLVAVAAAVAAVLLVWNSVQGDRATSAPVAPAETLFQDTVPEAPSVDDGASVELGVTFEVAEPGWVEGIRFFRAVGNGGPHRGSLWTDSGERLGTLTFAEASGSGWQEAAFESPIPVDPDQAYVASYHAPQGHYAADVGFYSEPHKSGRVSGLGSLYRYGPGNEFPDATHSQANYWVDVLYRANPRPPGSTILGDDPPEVVWDDRNEVELGMRLDATAPGSITGIRFFRGDGNSGPHTGRLWAEDGKELRTVPFPDGPVGWQVAPVEPPLAVDSGDTIVVSYHAPHGRYSATPRAFNEVGTVGIFKIPRGAGVYSYGSPNFPSKSFRDTSYWVDVLYEADAEPRATSEADAEPRATSEADAEPRATSELNLPRIPWEGGPAYWKRFQKTDAAGWDEPTFFPISVFLGKPSHAPQYKALGINTYMAAEHDGDAPSVITDQGMYLMAQQDEWALSEVRDDPGVVAWFISDECDMGLGGCGGGDEYDGLSIQKGFVEKVDTYKDGRFKHANFGNGILETHWSPNTMEDHVALVDSASADKYTYTSPHVWDIVADSPAWPSNAEVPTSASYGWQADQMRKLQNPEDPRPVWTFVETARPFLTEPGARTITPEQIEGAVWSAIIHEARGIAYFQHNNDGTCGTYSLVDCGGELRERIAKINSKVRSLAPVLNTQSFDFDFRSQTDTMLKVHKGDAHIFAGIGLEDAPGKKTFVLPPSVLGTTITVVGEDRTLPVEDGRFTDNFPAEHTHHVYKVSVR